MAALPILLHPDPRLRMICRPVADFDDSLAGLARDMFDTMYDAAGRGLAAPQIGVAQRLFVMDPGWKEGASAPQAFVNPEVVRAGDTYQIYTESCLSIPDSARRIARPAEVTLRWLDLNGRPHEGQFSGIKAVIVQHEIDHLDGVLLIDHPAAPDPDSAPVKEG